MMPLGDILIVEDEEGPRESLKQILKQNYRIHTASQGHEAFSILENTPIDLITVDLKLPGTPGHHLIADFKKISPRTEVMIVTGTGTLEAAIEGIRHGVSDFITKPFNVMDVLSAIRRVFSKILEKKQFMDTLHEINNSARHPMLFDANALMATGLNFSTLTNQSQTAPAIDVLEFARVLASTLDGQDRYTHGHSERVARLSLMIAEEFGFTPVEARDLQVAAYLHDIGKVGIDREIIRCPRPLSQSETTLLKSHPQRGLRMVSPLNLSTLARSVIRSHHESWDGTGYPDGLRAENIPLAARIVRVADSYDAMTSDRSYRCAKSQARAIAELRKGALSEFDPDVVDVFITRVIGSDDL